MSRLKTDYIFSTARKSRADSEKLVKQLRRFGKQFGSQVGIIHLK